MHSDESVFSFDLNETLFFNKNQEVAEIRGISLEPSISIQSFDDYVSIRGVIELQGEYERTEPSSEEDSYSEPVFFENDQIYRYIEEVKDIDDKFSEFNHRFPVEISVPTYRIDTIDNITVQITSFDYELRDATELNVFSTIDIHGIKNEQDVEDADDPSFSEQALEKTVDDIAGERTDEENEQFLSEGANKAFELSMFADDLTNERDQESEEETKESLDESVSVESSHEKKESSTESEETSEERWLWKQKQVQSLAEFFETNIESESSLSSSESSPESLESHESSESKESSESQESASSDRSTDLNYLTGMLRDEEEKYTKMRLCIVQETDTLRSIAERYDTTTMHIVSQNNLTEDDVSVGQLLYIPFRK